MQKWEEHPTLLRFCIFNSAFLLLSSIPTATNSTAHAVVVVIVLVRLAECASASQTALQLALKAASPLRAHDAPYTARAADASLRININAGVICSPPAPCAFAYINASANAYALSNAIAVTFACAFALLRVAHAAKRQN